MSHSDVVIAPAKQLAGMLQLPGDKSISHRYAMLAGIANGVSTLENFSTGADCASTAACMQALGSQVEKRGHTLEIEGFGPILRDPGTVLDCGNSGSTMRMLSGILAGQPFECELTGDASLSRRPMKRIMEPLQAMGAIINADAGHAPLRIRGGQLHAIEYTLPVPSAQVKSAVLLAGLYAGGKTAVDERVRTRDHTELALGAFGASVEREGNRIGVGGGQKLRPIHATIPGDISTAAFFLCAAAAIPGSDLLINNLLLNPTRAALLDVLAALGLRISIVRVEQQHGELTGTVHAQYGGMRGLSITGATSAALIDELPVLAAIGPYTEQGIEIRDARELRVKESDRIAAVAANLRAMGATVEEFEDGLRVPGAQKLRGGEVDAFEDHRIAMALAISALRAERETTIHGADAARISFPEFYDTLDSLVQH